MQPTYDEIAAFFEVNVDTIYERMKDCPAFSEALLKGRESGRVSLRRHQWKSARKGNVVMQIFLGKNWLKQRDKFDVTAEKEDKTITYNSGLRSKDKK